MERMTYRMNIAGLDRDLPLCRVSDELYIGAFIMFSDVELTKACAKALLEKTPEHDILISAEAKGIPLLYEMARQAGENDYIVARKGAKLYMQDVVSTGVTSITTDHKQELFLGRDEVEKLRGRRVVIVDDVISTGESLAALERLVTLCGGEIVAKMAVLAEGDAQDRPDIIYLEKLPLFNADGTVKA